MSSSTHRSTTCFAGVSAAILAGGLGTRLRPAIGDRPKPLAMIHDRPYLTFLLDQLADSGFREVVLLTGYGAEEVEATLGEEYRQMRLRYSPEPTPLGTAGAVRRALALLQSSTILLMNGDSWCDLNLGLFWKFHQRKRADLTMALAEVNDGSRFGTVELAPNGIVRAFGEKEQAAGKALINAGIYLVQRSFLREIPTDRPVSLEREMFPAWVGSGRAVFGFRGRHRFLDIGTPESYAMAEEFFVSPS